MKIRNMIRRMALAAYAVLAICAMPGCISDREETYVLEDPELTASKMIVGGWKQSAIKAVDEDVNDVPLSEAGVTSPEETPDVEFDDEGNYTVTYPDGTTSTGTWNISSDEMYLTIGGESWQIYSFGENKLVLMREVYYNGKYYYIMYIYERTSSPKPEAEPGDDVKIGGTNDNNPYKPYGKNLISKITENLRFTDGQSTRTVHTFQYDGKSRIAEYEVQKTNVRGVTETSTFRFVYDEEKVHLYMNDEMINNGTIGTNGYLSTLYKENGSTANSTFTYNSVGQLTRLVCGTQSWSPSYDYEGNMTSPDSGGDILNYSYDIFNNYSVDLNGLFSSCYQWEWLMHFDYSGVVFGLFDFYGQRGNRIAWKCQRGSYWTDTITDWTGGMNADPDSPNRLTDVEITRTAINNPFTADYKIEYID